MVDQVKERDNKDAESGRPVQLDPEEQGGKSDQHDRPRPGGEPAQPPEQPPAKSR